MHSRIKYLCRETGAQSRAAQRRINLDVGHHHPVTLPVVADKGIHQGHVTDEPLAGLIMG